MRKIKAPNCPLRHLPRQSKPGAINRHYTLDAHVNGTEYSYHATKGWRKRRNPDFLPDRTQHP